MGTRSTIIFSAGNEYEYIPLVKIYQQYDGYIKGVGYELANWLLKKNIVNGFSERNDTDANGVGCLTAQFIRDFKKEIGGLYIIPNDPDDFQDYNYEVVLNDLKTGNADDLTTIIVKRWDDEDPIFVGKPSELLKFEEKD